MTYPVSYLFIFSFSSYPLCHKANLNNKYLTRLTINTATRTLCLTAIHAVMINIKMYCIYNLFYFYTRKY